MNVERFLNVCDDDPTPELLHIKTQVLPATQISPQQSTTSFTHYPAYPPSSPVTDRPGAELFPEASVWQIYKKEANDYDGELVKGRNETLDTMLIFAALFSAILTAFLIESTSLLQEDPVETSAALLFILVQSQLGTTNLSSTIPDPPAFSPASSARWVNALWFAALALSLASALLAMLAKEWLDAFTSSHKRSPYAFAITRQARLDGFEAWRASHIMDLLPTLLHLSLLLFALGLVVYLWQMDRAIAMMLSAVITLTLLLYLGTIVCGAYYELCPFVTRISRYLQAGLRLNQEASDGSSKNEKLWSSEHTTAADVRALAWLAKNARDQESSKSAYQALAGLRQRPMKGSPSDGSKREHKKSLQEQLELLEFVEDFSLSFKSTLDGSTRELASCKRDNVTRYVRALPEIVTYVGAFNCKRQAGHSQPLESYALAKLAEMVDDTLTSMFEILDTLWDGECALDIPSYFNLVTAELRLIQVAMTNWMLKDSSESESAPIQAAAGGARIHIDMDSTSKRIISVHPAEVWSRYAASLSCVLSLIDDDFDSGWRGSINDQALLDLLEAVETTTVFMQRLPVPYGLLLHNKNSSYHIASRTGIRSFGDSIFQTALTELIGITIDFHPDVTLAVECGFARATYALGLLHKKALDDPNHLNLGHELHDLTTDHYSRKDRHELVRWVARVAVLAMSYTPSFELLEKSMRSLFGVIASSGPNPPEEWLWTVQAELTPLIQLAANSMSSWPRAPKRFLIGILVHRMRNLPPEMSRTIWGNVLDFWISDREADAPNPVLTLSSIIQHAPTCLGEVDALLDDLVKRFNEFGGPMSYTSETLNCALDDSYLMYFASYLGFDGLVKIGQNINYAPSAARSIVRLCTSARFHYRKAITFRERLLRRFGRVHGNDIDSAEGMQIFEEHQASPLVPHTQAISTVALPGFLAALLLVLDCIRADKLEGLPDVPKFAKCAMKLLNASLLASQGSFNDVCGYMAGEIARKLRQCGSPKLKKEAANAIAQYGQYAELPKQTEEEIELLQGER